MINLTGTQTIETPRLILRRFKMADAENCYNNYASNPNVCRYLTWRPHASVEGSQAFIQYLLGRYDDTAVFDWAIEFKKNNQVIGGISAVDFSAENEACELGYVLGENYWGKGIAAEALSHVMAYLFNTVGVNRICAKHNSENTASGRVMEKCGMKLEGTMRQAHRQLSDGRLIDLTYRAILKEEWAKIQSLS